MGALPPQPARRTSQHLGAILTAVAVVALLVVIGAGYGIAGSVTAGNKLTAANNAIDAASSHRGAFDNAPSTLDLQRSDAKAFQPHAIHCPDGRGPAVDHHRQR